MSLPDVVPVALRALSFVTALQAAGIPLFLWLFAGCLDGSTAALRALCKQTAMAAVLTTVAYQVTEPARLAGAFSGILDPSLQGMLLGSDAGTAHAMRLSGLVLILLGASKHDRLGRAATVVGGTLVAVSFAFMGHTVAHDQRWLLAGMLVLHVMIVAFWFGALLPLYLATTREVITASGLIIERFSVIAVRLVPLIFAAGLVMAILLLPDLASLMTPYGILILTKVAGFSALMVLAALNRWRWAPLIKAGDVRAIAAFRRSVRGEWGLIAGILAATAVMTSFFSPGH